PREWVLGCARWQGRSDVGRSWWPTVPHGGSRGQSSQPEPWRRHGVRVAAAAVAWWASPGTAPLLSPVLEPISPGSCLPGRRRRDGREGCEVTRITVTGLPERPG